MGEMAYSLVYGVSVQKERDREIEKEKRDRITIFL
jgi:hypothetical protein